MPNPQNKIPLRKLTSELCPDGVEYKPIGDVVNYEQPGKYIVASTNYSEKYKTPVLTAGQTFILGYTNETENIYPASKEKPVIIFDDFTGAFKWVDFPFKVKSSAMKMLHADTEKTTLRYIFHMMGKINFSSDEHQRLWIGKYSTLQIPVPPTEVQREIVRILDKFTDLNALLETELIARKKQYEYYREKLLTFPADVPRVALGEIGTFTRGNGLQKKDFTDSGVPCIHYGQIYTYYGNFTDKTKSFVSPECAKSLRKAKKGDLIIVTTSENIEDVCKCLVWLGDGEVCVGGETSIFSHNQNPKYIAYCLQTANFFDFKKKNFTGTKVIRVNQDKLKNFEIPLPPLSEQKRIADILDRFDLLCNDLTSGIPAEIAARKKQYEYYRDRLLTFREKIS